MQKEMKFSERKGRKGDKDKKERQKRDGRGKDKGKKCVEKRTKN
jgi:hypothetical protein